MKTGVVLLAAGQSKRFGSDKRIASLRNKSSYSESDQILFQTLRHIHLARLPVFVVLHRGDEVLAARLTNLRANWGVCPDAHLGMGHSLAYGVRCCQHWHNWIIALADMPWVSSASYRHIATALTANTIIRPCYSDPEATTDEQPQPGNPVGFPRRYGWQLMQCNGDSGARHLLQSQQHQVTDLIVNDPGILRDIDTPQQL